MTTSFIRPSEWAFGRDEWEFVKNVLPVISIIVALIALWLSRKKTAFDIAHARNLRYVAAERELKSRPEALRLYGINPDRMERDGVTIGSFVHLNDLVYVLTAESDAQRKKIARFIKKRDYWHRFLAQRSTQKAWAYVRHLHSYKWREQIDRYFREKHKILYPDLPVAEELVMPKELKEMSAGDSQ